MKTICNAILSLLLILGTPFLFTGCGSHSGEEGEEHENGHEHEHEGETFEVEVSEEQMNAVGITLGHPESRSISETLPVNGVLAIDPKNEAVAAPPVGGTVSRICVSPGDRVSKGTVVAYVDVYELATLRSELLTAKAEERAAKIEADRQEALAAQGAGVRKNLDNARSNLNIAQTRVQGIASRIRQYGASPEGSDNSIPVKADISGVVTEVMASNGAFADMQSPILKIADISNLYCNLQVLEKDLNQIKQGQTVEMRLTNDPEVTFTGKVIDVNPVLDPETKTTPVKVSVVMDQKAMIVPGMAVSANISLSGKQGMALPEGAIVKAGDKSYIFVLEDVHNEDGKKMYHFEKREVICGPTTLGYTEITPLEDLEADAQIVVTNAFFLNSMSSDHGEHNH